jgi:hypothetical protein
MHLSPIQVVTSRPLSAFLTLGIEHILYQAHCKCSFAIQQKTYQRYRTNILLCK